MRGSKAQERAERSHIRTATETEAVQVMDAEGRADEDAIKEIPESLVLRMYRLMVFTRLWNAKALSLQRQGRMGTLASVAGQEAANVGMGMALAPGDWFVPAFRELGALFARGWSARDQFLYWGGDERGGRPPENSHVLPVSIVVGSHLCHAAGIAMGAKIRGERVAVLSSSGDGSTSRGDFHEGLNFAGVFKLPVVFAIQNNGWAISLPVSRQTATETLAEKACAYNIDGIRVDGNDVFAVYLTLRRALDSARYEHRPCLAELVTYRLGDHTTSDDARRYRSDEDVAYWQARDPIDRMRKYLSRKRGWDEAKETNLIAGCRAEIDQAVKEYEGTTRGRATQIFDHLYANMPWNIKEEMEEVRRHHNKERT